MGTVNTRNNERNQTIIRYNLIGIGINLFLAIFKMAAGILAHAHAVTLTESIHYPT